MPATPTTKFTLRFRNPRNPMMLGLLAEQFGVSKNQLAEEMLESGLQTAALLLADDLTGTLELLQRYRRDEHVQDAIAEFARAEAEEVDPIRTRMVSDGVLEKFSAEQDPYGIAKAFA